MFRDLRFLHVNQLFDMDVRIERPVAAAKPAYGHDYAQIVENGGTQVGHDAPGFLDGVLYNRGKMTEQLGAARTGLDLLHRVLDAELHRAQRGTDAVVQFPRDSLALVLLRLQELRSQGLQLVFRFPERFHRLGQLHGAPIDSCFKVVVRLLEFTLDPLEFAHVPPGRDRPGHAPGTVANRTRAYQDREGIPIRGPDEQLLVGYGLSLERGPHDGQSPELLAVRVLRAKEGPKILRQAVSFDLLPRESLYQQRIFAQGLYLEAGRIHDGYPLRDMFQESFQYRPPLFCLHGPPLGIGPRLRMLESPFLHQSLKVQPVPFAFFLDTLALD